MVTPVGRQRPKRPRGHLFLAFGRLGTQDGFRVGLDAGECSRSAAVVCSWDIRARVTFLSLSDPKDSLPLSGGASWTGSNCG